MQELIQKANELKREIEAIRKTINDTDDARRINEGAYNKKHSLESKYWKIQDKINQLDSYEGNKELKEIVTAIIDKADEDWNAFKFFSKAKASFINTNNGIRTLHIEIVCSQICDDNVKNVLENAEKITKRKLIDWFISASIGYNPQEQATAWLTYHLTFQGSKLKTE